MEFGPPDSLGTLSSTELIGLVRRLVGEVERFRKETEKLTAALASANREKQELKDEIRRLKGLPPRPPRPPTKPSGMEEATDRPAPQTPSAPETSPPRRRGPGVSKLSVGHTVTLTASAPEGSRHKGYEDIIVQDLAFKPEVTLYRRERWVTPDGRTVTADLPAGVVGGCGPHLHRMVLMLHFQGQMTCERIVAVLTAAGLSISKRQVVRLLSAKLDLFRAEEEAVFTAGLRASGYVSVDGAGAATPARPAPRRSSAPTGSPPSAPGRANPALRSCAICSVELRATRSMRRRKPTCARPIWRMASSTR